MDLFLDASSRRGATRALFEQLRDAIVSGRLAEGDRLPPSRSVASDLGVSRHTVTTVYGRLAAEGYIEGRAGGGSYVCSTTPAPASRRRPAALAPTAAMPAMASGDVWRGAADGGSPRFDLRPGTPDPALFPLVAWRRCLTSAYQTMPVGYGDPAGLPSLRNAIAHWIGRSRGVDANADQVIVTAGAQQGMDLVTRLLVRPGEIVAVEEPGYAPMRQLCAALGAVVEPVPVDSEGIVVEQIPHRARIVYTTPSHQSPTGVTMSLPRRRALLAFAERHDVGVIEDDYDSEYRHADRPLEPLYRLDRTGRVLYLGTFSKTLSPSLRLGFLVLPDPLVGAAVNLRTLMDWQPPASLQTALLRFIVDGLLDRHLRRTRRIYSERHRLVACFVHAAAAAGLLVDGPTGCAGLHVTALLPVGISEAGVRAEAQAGGVALGDLAGCWLRPDHPGGLVIGFGAVATDDLADALAVVGAVLEQTACMADNTE